MTRAQYLPDLVVTEPGAIHTDLRAYSTIAAAITDIGATPATLLISRDETVAAGTTIIPANVTVKFTAGSVLTVPSGTTLTINGIILNNRTQIFDISAADDDSVEFGNMISTVFPDWFGFSESATGAVNAKALHVSMNALSEGGTCWIGIGDFTVTTGIVKFPKRAFILQGSGHGDLTESESVLRGTVLSASGTGKLLEGATLRSVVIKDMILDGESTTSHLLYIDSIFRSTIQNIVLIKSGGVGLFVNASPITHGGNGGAYYNKFLSIFVDECAGIGVEFDSSLSATYWGYINSNHLDCVSASNCGSDGIKLTGVYNTTLTNCTSEKNDGHGLHLDHCIKVQVFGGTWELNGEDAAIPADVYQIYLSSAYGYGCTFHNCNMVSTLASKLNIRGTSSKSVYDRSIAWNADYTAPTNAGYHVYHQGGLLIGNSNSAYEVFGIWIPTDMYPSIGFTSDGKLFARDVSTDVPDLTFYRDPGSANIDPNWRTEGSLTAYNHVNRVYEETSAAADEALPDDYNSYYYFLTANTVFSGFPTAKKGKHFYLYIRQAAAGSKTVTFHADCNVWLPGGSYTMTASGGAVDVFHFEYNGQIGKWLVISLTQDVR